MIIWLNGNFGAGKTSTATALQSLWPGSILFDPEVLGIGLRLWTPPQAFIRDFQDIQLWRDLVVTTCAGLVAEWGRPLIVPMTLLRPPYFHHIVGGLREIEADLYHFCLTAPVEVLRARATERAHEQGEGGDLTWLEERWAAYDAFDPLFAEHVDTTTGTPGDIARLVASRLPSPLPVTLGRARWTNWIDEPSAGHR